MSALHAVPTDTFGIQQPVAATQGPKYVREDSAATDSDGSIEQIREEGEYEEGDAQDKEDVDESVKEDMRKLEDTFPGISDRFRLLNRIGEGIVQPINLPLAVSSHIVAASTCTDGLTGWPWVYRYLFHRVQSRGPLVRPL